MELNIKGKTALVTGGSKGIGLAIREALEREGCDVVSWSRTEGQDIDLYLYKIPDIDILINNVGGRGSVREDSSYFNWDVQKDLTEQFIKQDKKWGRVINITSIYGKEKGHNPYFTAMKAAQIAFIKSLAGTVPGTTLNSIAPGHIDVGKPFPDNPKILGSPEDVANIVTFLCSDKAKHINGACITVDGGESHSF